MGAFHQGLALLGWSIGRNVRIDIGWGAGDAERSRKYAAELTALAPDVILASGDSTVGAFLQATRCNNDASRCLSRRGRPGTAWPRERPTGAPGKVLPSTSPHQPPTRFR
jgi:hypothetical protein